jgi:hypothetical protein
MTTKLKSSLPPSAQARAQEWFDVASAVAKTKGQKTSAKARTASLDFWIYEDDNVKIEKWGECDMLSVAVRVRNFKSLLLVLINNGKVITWSPEEETLDYLKSLVVLELLANQ